MKKESLGWFMSTAVRILPGIGSYQDREACREADQELRLKMSRRLSEMIDSVDKIKNECAQKGQLKVLKLLEDLTTHMDRISRSLQFLPRGYSALFDSRKVDEEVLDQILDYDNYMMKDIEELKSQFERLSQNFALQNPDPEAMRDVIVILERIERKISDRERIFVWQGSERST